MGAERSVFVMIGFMNNLQPGFQQNWFESVTAKVRAYENENLATFNFGYLHRTEGSANENLQIISSLLDVLLMAVIYYMLQLYYAMP